MCMYARCFDLDSVSTNFLLDIEALLTGWYFVFFITF